VVKKHIYTPENICPQEISFEIENGIVRHVNFEGGCDGNLKALSKLVEGMRVEEVAQKLKGIDCAGRGTSCADQLAKALNAAANPVK
jgi:uncharacterized protein (TIGR03905 family)